VVGLLPHVIGNGVAGARVRRRDRGGKDVREESLGADLVVDASGRGSRAPRWLEALGYPAPRETVVNSFLAYASRLYRRPGRLAANGKGLHLQGTPANGGRGGLALPVEGDRLIVTRTGRGEACPPTDEAGFLAFAGDLADPALYDVLRDAEPLSPVAGHRATENRVRHYERLARRPENFVVLGDAACAFNPVYGQGMTTAALAAVTLGEALRGQPRGDLTGLAGRFQRRLARVNATPWLLATAEDFSYPATEGERPGWWARRKQRHLGRVVRLSTRDLRARRELLEVLHLAKPFATLFRPRLLLAVLRQAWGRSPGGPGGAAEAMSGEVVPR
jgi:2-polyprenyl-6-methoxyphenol hydroxylase-like FAD-dependent oxidoreductase